MAHFSSHRLFCWYGSNTPVKEELKHIRQSLSDMPTHTSVSRKNNICVTSSREHYIRQHQQEGLFFQQRYQAAYKDQGETVQDVLNREWFNSKSSDVDNWKQLFEMEELWEKPLLQLSSGEWQRFSLCKSLASKPDILIAPGGLKGLDHRWQHKILDILSENGSSVHRVIFTSDRPIQHPAVVNISGHDHPINLSTQTRTDIPEILKKYFTEYQSQFLSRDQNDVVIRMDGVSIVYSSRTILNNISWTVRTQDKWNIHGPNGAGKSTLLSLVNADNPQGYSQPIELFGHKYGRYSIWERKSRIAYFGSDYFQYFRSLKSSEQVLLQLLHTPYLDTLQPSRALIDESLSYFGLSEHRATPYSRLSPELRRQLLLVAVYLKSSDVLVLDEPYQDFNLDRIHRNNDFLEAVQPQSAQTILFVTHREDHKPGFLDKVLEIDQGRSRIIQ